VLNLNPQKMDHSIRERLVSWISHNPESSKPDDINRLYDLVYECCINDQSINENDIKTAVRTHKEWSEGFLLVFIDEALNRFNLLIGMIKYLRKRGVVMTKTE